MVKKTANWRSITNSPLFDAYTLNVSTSGGKTIFNQLGINNLSDYEPKHHLLINLGYSDKVRKTINLSFIGANQIYFKHVKVVAVPYGKTYRQQTKQLQSTGLTHQHVTNNTVEGTSTATTRRILTTSIPYSKGWQLSVDGKKQATQVVNSGFVGAILPKGQHQITLRYQTPGLRLGLWLSILGVSLSLVLIAGEIAKWYLTRVQYRR
ncbi:YfhO family protein [Secundilactobacillus odoratitofui]|uniref:YfhO family protein n=1 Tax=Secundilactobacillus odoratitofui TaxID=480930 RepID=UPI0020927B51|nr:YfhO family protein [Secundilactobacillus odoratitofui]